MNDELPADPVTDRTEAFAALWVTYHDMRRVGFSKCEASRILAYAILDTFFNWSPGSEDEQIVEEEEE